MRPSAMAAEIREIPTLVATLLSEGADSAREVAAAIHRAAPGWATIVGRGTSDHAATYGRYLLETHLRIPTGLAAPSVTTVYAAPLEWAGGLVLAVSQSGQSDDVVAVVAAARDGGALTVAVTNELASPLAEAAEHVIACHAGTERSVAATKTYVAEVVALAAMVGHVVPAEALSRPLARLPRTLEHCLALARRWVDESGVADAFADADRALIVSRGYNFATALETALKLKETAGLFAEGYSTADLLHGPIALAAPAIPVLAYRPDGPMGARIDEGLARVTESGAATWIVGGRLLAEGAGERRSQAPQSRLLALPFDLPEALSPAAFILPGQLLAERVAVNRGLDPDLPRGLAKVTRTQ